MNLSFDSITIIITAVDNAIPVPMTIIAALLPQLVCKKLVTGTTELTLGIKRNADVDTYIWGFNEWRVVMKCWVQQRTAQMYRRLKPLRCSESATTVGIAAILCHTDADPHYTHQSP